MKPTMDWLSHGGHKTCLFHTRLRRLVRDAVIAISGQSQDLAINRLGNEPHRSVTESDVHSAWMRRIQWPIGAGVVADSKAAAMSGCVGKPVRRQREMVNWISKRREIKRPVIVV